jgi:hypothetical protein
MEDLMRGSLITTTGLIVAGIVFVVLFVILSVTLWVSIVAAVAALILWAGIGGSAVSHRSPHPGRG